MPRQRESEEQALARKAELAVLAATYPTFVPFLQDMMLELGFTTSAIQEEIAEYVANGPEYLMVQAQRGQAKTTIVAIYAVWSLIHNPKLRVLILSAGETQANEISTLIVRLIMNVDILEMLRPDKSMGDRTSVEHFDVHYSLKGIDKSPSVACVGINGNLQGKRADLLIADDVESQKLSRTAMSRAQLLDITRDFTSINSTGRIVWLGTPQSIDSIYNTLPGRGVSIRIWPGRLPTAEQATLYGDMLAPSVIMHLKAKPEDQTGYGLDGKQGIALDERLGEATLTKKELDQGPSYFQLQHMLLTALTDALRFPLKPENLVVMRFDDRVPLTVERGFGGSHMKHFNVMNKKYSVSMPHKLSDETGELKNTLLYIDPAGGGVNADETGYAFGGLLNSNIYVKTWGGVKGGYHKDQLQTMADIALKLRPAVIVIEKNFGYGAYKEVITPVITATFKAAGLTAPPIMDDMVSGQKEARIIDTLEPVIGRGALVLHEDAILNEEAGLARYDLKARETYGLMHQLSRITREKNALIHDDRLDALAGLVKSFLPALAQDQDKATAAIKEAEVKAFLANPLKHPAHTLQRKPSTPGWYGNRVRRL